jgi:tetratricopeptide (TPR) repeat protein
MTTTTALENRPESLRRVADRLWARHERGGGLRAEELDALTEAWFRLAVHTDTAPGTALDLLAAAHRLDPVNPKHPYHAGLIHLRQGRLDAAQQWLNAAAESAPANHRVWAHLAIVHEGLHEQRIGDLSYDGKERRRVTEIVSAVREGRDDLAASEYPSGSPLRPGPCRWSGVHDISAELVLRRPVGERSRDAIAKDLRRVAELADHRRGGVAAFTVLAVQWLVHGYPPATIHRIASALPPGEGPARRMLEVTCELFETDEAELPARLAMCLARQELPDLLVALVHQRRLLWRPLRVPDMGAFTAARRFASTDEPGDAAAHLDAMESALRAITTATPPTMPADVATEDTGPDADPGVLLARLESAAATISRLDKSAGVVAKALRRADLGDASRSARARVDHALLTDIAERLDGARRAQLDTLHQFTSEKTAARAEKFDTQLERCEKALQQPLRLKAHLGALRKKLRGHEGQPATPVAPSAVLLAIDAELGSLAPRTERVLLASPRRGPVPEEPRERVAFAVAEVEEALADNASRAWHSLEAYAAELRRRSALVLLRSYLNDRLAESLHRMGTSTPARRHWQAMLAEEPMSTAVLHNLAVAHTAAGDVAAATEAWSRYLEAHYAEALLAGTPTRGAAERAEIHRALAGSFGTAALCGRFSEDGYEPQPRGAPAELTSPARVALAVAHLRLEELNRALAYRSTVLRLGVARSVRRPELDEAFDTRLSLVAAACAPLRHRVRAPFEELCRSAFQAAHEAACDPGQRTREATDPDEEGAHTAWTHERVRWKARIARDLVGADDWPVTESSGEILTSLLMLDELRLDSEDVTVRQAVLQLGASTTYLRQLNNLTDIAAEFAADRIGRAAENKLESSDDLGRRYRGIYLSWQRNGVAEHHLDLLDDPQAVYFPSVKRAFDMVKRAASAPVTRAAVLAAIPAMEYWIVRLRGAAGPAAMLGELLRAVDEHRRAQPVLAEARAAAIPRDSMAYIRLSIVCDEYEDARTRLRRLARNGEHAVEARRLLTVLFHRWVSSDGDLPTMAEIHADLPPSPEAELAHGRRSVITEVTIAKHKRRPGGVDPDSLATDLRQLLQDDEDNTHARFEHTRLLYQHALRVRTAMRRTIGARRETCRDELTRLCKECAAHAGHLLDRDPAGTYDALANENRLEEIRKIAEKVERYG